jgi:hypothetical protein
MHACPVAHESLIPYLSIESLGTLDGSSNFAYSPWPHGIAGPRRLEDLSVHPKPQLLVRDLRAGRPTSLAHKRAVALRSPPVRPAARRRHRRRRPGNCCIRWGPAPLRRQCVRLSVCLSAEEAAPMRVGGPSGLSVRREAACAGRRARHAICCGGDDAGWCGRDGASSGSEGRRPAGRRANGGGGGQPGGGGRTATCTCG